VCRCWTEAIVANSSLRSSFSSFGVGFAETEGIPPSGVLEAGFLRGALTVKLCMELTFKLPLLAVNPCLEGDFLAGLSPPSCFVYKMDLLSTRLTLDWASVVLILRPLTLF
jgi:hypothetical protein